MPSLSKLQLTSVVDKLSLNGKNAIVYGGSSGIGMGTAIVLAKKGCSVTLIGSNLKKCEAALEKLKEVQPPESEAILKYHVLDGCNFSSIRTFCNEYVSTHSSLHYLILSAGGLFFKEKDTTFYNGRLSRLVALNYMSRYIFAKELAPLMEKTKLNNPIDQVTVLQILNPTLAGPTLADAPDLGFPKAGLFDIRTIIGPYGLMFNLLTEELGRIYKNIGWSIFILVLYNLIC
jgi:NAD(P)-dependent dehydrogenase (short-subunit alcohol dehydrogenase family)